MKSQGVDVRLQSIEVIKFALFLVVAGIYTGIGVHQHIWEVVGPVQATQVAQASPAYLMVAAASGCVALIPSPNSALLRSGPLLTSVGGAYFGTWLFAKSGGPNTELAAALSDWIHPVAMAALVLTFYAGWASYRAREN